MAKKRLIRRGWTDKDMRDLFEVCQGLEALAGELACWLTCCTAAISRFEWESQLKLLTINQLDHLRAAGMERETRTGDL